MSKEILSYKMRTTHLKPPFICKALLKTHHSSPQRYEEEEFKMLLLFGYNAWHTVLLYIVSLPSFDI